MRQSFIPPLGKPGKDQLSPVSIPKPSNKKREHNIIMPAPGLKKIDPNSPFFSSTNNFSQHGAYPQESEMMNAGNGKGMSFPFMTPQGEYDPGGCAAKSLEISGGFDQVDHNAPASLNVEQINALPTVSRET